MFLSLWNSKRNLNLAVTLQAKSWILKCKRTVKMYDNLKLYCNEAPWNMKTCAQKFNIIVSGEAQNFFVFSLWWNSMLQIIKMVKW